MNEPAAYLLDTNVVSEMMRPEPDQRVANALQLVARAGILRRSPLRRVH